MTHARSRCLNCDAPLRGEYCSQCGQREGRGNLRFGEVMGELVEELFSWDSRIWRTLIPLVFRPGFLTAEFIAGRRARYVPPFRLYLVISFLLFLVVSLFANGVVVNVRVGDSTEVETEASIVEGVFQDAGPDSRARAMGEVAPRSADSNSQEQADVDINIELVEDDSPQWLKGLDKRLETNASELAKSPGSFFELLVEYLPEMMFLLLPVFALLLKFCYLFSPFHYLHHLVFSLHFHSFVYLLYLFAAPVRVWLLEGDVGMVMPLVFLLYLPMALMRSYGSGLGAAVGKSLVILAIDFVLLLLSFALVSLLVLALM